MNVLVRHNILKGVKNMGMTITEKIIAQHAGLPEVHSGELVAVLVDGILTNDISGPLALKEFEKIGVDKVFDKEKIFLLMDHFTSNANIQAATNCKYCRDFAKKQSITHFYDSGRVGIEHAFLPEKGLVLPGQIILGGDSHTCTYGALGAFSTGVGSTDIAAAMVLGETWLRIPESVKCIYHGNLKDYVAGKDLILLTIGKIGVSGARYKAIEFAGEVIDGLSVDSRLTMCNMAIEAGAKNGIMKANKAIKDYVSSFGQKAEAAVYYESDKDAIYEATIEFDVSDLEPQVALPSSPGNAVPVGECSNVMLDQVVIGSCTNGRMEDLRTAAKILKGKKTHPYLRTVIIPATIDIYRKAVEEGLIDIFIDAGAVVSTPTCGPCFGGHMGCLAAGEKAISTTNRNFVGRMGDPSSKLYLSGPAVAAASAIKGRIAHPKEVQ